MNTDKFKIHEALNGTKVFKLLNVKLSELGQKNIALPTFNAKNNAKSRNTFRKQSKALRMALNIVAADPQDYVKRAPIGRMVGVNNLSDVYQESFMDNKVVKAFVQQISEEVLESCKQLEA